MNYFAPIIAGNIEIRLINSQEELRETLHLRYKELLLPYNPKNKNKSELFKDLYDEQSDHLIAIDHSTNQIVGTYRLLRNDMLKSGQSFVTEQEFDITKIKGNNILEIGRAVVKREFRNGAIIILLLIGLLKYAYIHRIKYLFGTASFRGTNPGTYSQALSYIYYHLLLPEHLKVKAQRINSHPINILPKEKVDYNLAKKQMPALIKGYINVGATFGEDAFIDYDFNSIDLFVLADTAKISKKYIERYVKE